MLPWGFNPLYPDRQINNIYFDTPSLDTFHENAAGTGMRRKFRLRWYGAESWQESACTFEIKERYLERGNKTSHKVDLKGSLLKVRELPGVPATLQPVLVNSYTRSYFGTARGTFRLTIDRQLRFGGLLFHHPQDWGTGSQKWTEDPAITVELKYDSAFDDQVDPILQNLPFRLQKNSKYVQGVQLLYG